MTLRPGGEAPSGAALPVDLALIRRIAVGTFLAGAGASAAALVATDLGSDYTSVLGVVTATLLATALVLGVVPLPPRWVLEASALWSIALVGTLIAVRESISMTPVYLLWPVVLIAYLARPLVLGLTFGWMVAVLAVALAVNDTQESRLDIFIQTVLTVGVMAILIRMLTRQQVRLRTELATAAQTDPLTGLLNRRALDARCADIVAEAAASGSPCSLVMLDLDHFKLVNDELGHAAGDVALQEFARVLERQSREGDVVARFGGEEFAVVLPGADRDAAVAYAERVAAALMDSPDPVRLSTSAGIAVTTGGRHDVRPSTVEGLLLGADRALYAAKAAGRDRAGVWDDPIELRSPFGQAAPADAP